ncbi:MAG: hypothetical protein IKH27_01275 [Oscillospiraceae bacterium]|nr:hypothetical protein [Oscillospiraceae bacterium]MBR3446422.1 hypothetical protein [Oscillospiraceae bacterium]
MKHKKLLAAVLSLLLLTGCAESPDSDIIIHKDMEKLIDEAQQTDESKAEVSDLQQNDRYTADFENESLRVSVHADAEVEIPAIDRLSMYRVQQRRFTQEDCDRVRAALMGNAPLTDCTQLMQIRTKAQLEEMIAEHRQMLAEEEQRIANDPDYAELIKKNNADSLEDRQRRIDELQAEYEAAPDMIDYAVYASDGKLEKNADRIAQEQNENGFWHGYCRDIADGDTLWVCTQDGKSLLHTQNTDSYSNVMWYSTSPIGYENCGVYIAELPTLAELGSTGANLEPLPDETANLSREEAEQKAESFLHQVGADDFICCEGEKLTACETLTVQKHTDFRQKEQTYARTYWVLRYYRSVGGAPVGQPSGTKKAEGTEKDGFKEKMWPAEVIELRINDSGIVRMQWSAPLEITETVVENAAMKPFAEITASFEKMLPMTATNSISDLDTDITIDRVELSYSRISEKDDFDTGLIVPVWAFYGSRKVTGEDYYDQHLSFTGVQLALNAIDGSVIDAELGY